MRARGALSRFAADTAGVSAVEFALILPVILTAFFGTIEVSNYVAANRKVTTVAASAADLIAQDTQVSNAEMADIFRALDSIMVPYNPNDGSIVITSVQADAGNVARVLWSNAVRASPRAAGSAVALPPGLVTPGQSIIMAEVAFTYRSPLGQFVVTDRASTEVFYARPRRSPTVQRIS